VRYGTISFPILFIASRASGFVVARPDRIGRVVITLDCTLLSLQRRYGIVLGGAELTANRLSLGPHFVGTGRGRIALCEQIG
jgi:hypothetical protein